MPEALPTRPQIVSTEGVSAPVPASLAAAPAPLRPVHEQPSQAVMPVSPALQPRPVAAPRSLSPVAQRRPVFQTTQMPAPTPIPVEQQRPVAVPPPVSVPAPAPERPVAEQPVPANPQFARHLSLDMDLPGAESTSALERLSHPKWRSVRRWSVRVGVATIVLMVTVGGFLFSQGFLKAHKVFKGGTATAAALKANVDPALLKGEGSGRVNILLLGRGGGTHEAPDLTDTIMIASVDPINHTTALISIPRDLWVNVANAGVMKINAAWETGEFKYLGKAKVGSTDPKAIQAGFDVIDQVVSDSFGITPDYNVIVDFKAFQQAVDTVGGVNMDVPTDLVDPTMAWENANNPVLAKAGIQVFNGPQALRYARSRETSSDFARAQRQRSLLLALKDKVDTLGTLSNPVKISGLLSAFGDNVSTDLSLSNANRLYGILKQVGDSSVNSIGLADAGHQYVTTGNINGQSVVIPKAGLFNYSDIQSYIRSQLKDPYIVRENAKILVLNGTTVAGLASTKADELKSYGYNVVATANTPNSGWTQTTLVDLTKTKKYTRHYLEEHFNQTAANELSDKTIPTNGADFVIIVGSDEATVTPTQTH